MIIYLWGADSYRRGKKLREVLENYKNKYETHDMLHVDFSEEPEDGWIKARDFLKQPSMFVESKVLALYGAGIEEYKENKGLLRDELHSDKTFIVISDPQKPHSEFSFLLKNPSRAQEFRVPTGREFEKFVLEESSLRGVQFDDFGLKYFVGFLDEIHRDEKTGPPDRKIWKTISELEKLSLVKKEGPFLKDDVEQMLRFFSNKNFYGLVGFLLSGRDRRIRLSALEELFSGNFDPAYIFNALGFISKGSDSAFLADQDVLIKSGKLDYDTALLKIALR